MSTMLTMSTSSNMFKNANVEIADIDIDSKPPMLPLKSLTKMFIPTLCYSTDSKVLTMYWLCWQCWHHQCWECWQRCSIPPCATLQTARCRSSDPPATTSSSSESSSRQSWTWWSRCWSCSWWFRWLSSSLASWYIMESFVLLSWNTFDDCCAKLSVSVCSLSLVCASTSYICNAMWELGIIKIIFKRNIID